MLPGTVEISSFDFWTNILLMGLVWASGAVMLGLTAGSLLVQKGDTT